MTASYRPLSSKPRCILPSLYKAGAGKCPVSLYNAKPSRLSIDDKICCAPSAVYPGWPFWFGDSPSAGRSSRGENSAAMRGPDRTVRGMRRHSLPASPHSYAAPPRRVRRPPQHRGSGLAGPQRSDRCSRRVRGRSHAGHKRNPEHRREYPRSSRSTARIPSKRSYVWRRTSPVGFQDALPSTAGLSLSRRLFLASYFISHSSPSIWSCK
jgi:hypothetical protein